MTSRLVYTHARLFLSLSSALKPRADAHPRDESRIRLTSSGGGEDAHSRRRPIHQYDRRIALFIPAPRIMGKKRPALNTHPRAAYRRNKKETLSLKAGCQQVGARRRQRRLHDKTSVSAIRGSTTPEMEVQKFLTSVILWKRRPGTRPKISKCLLDALQRSICIGDARGKLLGHAWLNSRKTLVIAIVRSCTY